MQSALFENNVFLVAQHMMQAAVMGVPPAPMPSRISPWAVYDVFTVANDEQIFLAVVSDTQWAVFCEAFGFADLKADPRLANNSLRVANRDTMIPMLRERLAGRSAAELAAVFEKEGLPYAPIVRPEDLFEDPHLLATGGLAPVTVPADGSLAGRPIETRTALLPLTLGGERLGLRLPPPALGGHTREIARPSSATAPPRSPRCTPTAWSAPTRSSRRRRPSRPTPEAAAAQGTQRARQVASKRSKSPRSPAVMLSRRCRFDCRMRFISAHCSRFSFSRSSSIRAARSSRSRASRWRFLSSWRSFRARDSSSLHCCRYASCSSRCAAALCPRAAAARTPSLSSAQRGLWNCR